MSNATCRDPLGSWLEVPPALFGGTAPSASLDHLEAEAAPAHPGAPPEHLGSLAWPQHPASGRLKVPSTCATPRFSAAALVDYAGTAGGSIMHSLTRNMPRTCLSASDMHGLYLLYPVCDEVVSRAVSCTKATQLSGFLRLLSVVGVPLCLAMVVVLLPLSYLRRRDAKVC